MNFNPNEHKLVNSTVNYLSKKLGYSKEEAKEKGIDVQNRRAEIKNNGEFITIIPKAHPDNMPIIEIRDPDKLECVLNEYLQTVKETNILSTQMNGNHKEKFFLFNIWKNATQSDCLRPVNFIKRYIDFIKDQTFHQFDNMQNIGIISNNMILVKREQDDIGFETPYIMHISLTDGRNIYNLPWIRYGVSTNRNGEKIAYIYGLQHGDVSLNKEYNEKIKKIFNTLNTGVKNYRNTTPSAIAALTIFLGMLESEGIKGIKAPDFLGFRYGKYVNTNGTIEEQDNIQENVTNKFLRNFFRLETQIGNIDIVAIPDQTINSFLCINLNEFKEDNVANASIKKLYKLGLNSKFKKDIMYKQDNDITRD